MAVLIFNCLVTWFSAIFFLIFVLLKVDGILSWNWFAVFIPMWIYDVVVIVDLSFKIALRKKLARSQPNQPVNSISTNIWRLIASLLKLLFEALLCTYLQYDAGLSLFYVMIPLWCLLLGTIIEVGIFTFKSQ